MKNKTSVKNNLNNNKKNIQTQALKIATQIITKHINAFKELAK